MEKRLKELGLTVVFAFISLFLIRYAFMIFAPFIIGLVVASLLEPMVRYLAKKAPFGRTLSVVIVLIIVLIIIVFLLIIGVSRIYFELNQIVQTLPDYNTLVEQFEIIDAGGWKDLLSSWNISPAIISAIEENLQAIFDAVRSSMLQLANMALNTVSGFPIALMTIFFSFVATFFISRDKDKIRDNILKLFPDEWQDSVFRVMKELSSSAIGYIRAQLILISISGFIAFLGLSILDSEYALTIGLLTAVLDLIPIIGPAFIFYPWLIFSLLSGNIGFAIGLLIIHLLITAVRELFEGKIIGDSLGLHPLATMIALFAGFRILGVIGFIIGPTVLVIIKSLARTNLLPYWEVNE
ncbi:MAG: sporulation integral membrane protein YtvI [Bacillota bacterium]